jgi:ActR/RegA family two-component response regulator
MDMEKRKRVLIIDDQPNWRALFSELLEEEYDITALGGYEEALRCLDSQDPGFHLAVVDIRLDDSDSANEDGLRLVDRLNRLGRGVNVIVVTGYSTIRTAMKAVRDLGVYEYLLKYPEDGSAFDHRQFRETARKAVEDAERKRRKPFVFVAMPFAPQYTDIYRHVVKQVVESEGLVCIRADDLFEPRRIIDEIKRSIEAAAFIIGDFSGRSPNVFYEIGMAHAMGKSVLLLTQGMDDVPPKLRDVRNILYRDSLDGAKELEEHLKKAVQALRKRNYRQVPLFQKKEGRTDPRLCAALISLSQPGKRTFRQILSPAAQEHDLTVVSAQGIFSTRHGMVEIWEQLNRARLVIADLSDKDPDVFYLTGLCHGLGKDVILMARKPEDIPFDLAGPSHVIYSDRTFADGLKARKDLSSAIQPDAPGGPHAGAPIKGVRSSF